MELTMAEGEQGTRSLAQSAAGILTNRRDIFRGATGLAAVALVGSAIADQNRVAVAAGANGTIVGQIGNLGPFEVLSFSWGASNSSTGSSGGGGGTGKASFQDLSFTRLSDTFTPALFVAVANGTHFQTASITSNNKKGNPVFTLALEGVMLSSWTLSDVSEAASPTESISLNFTKVTLTFGTASGGWDITQNKSV